MAGHGGKREGAGRPVGAKTRQLKRYGTGRRFLLDLINDASVPVDLQLRGAIALLEVQTRGIKAARQEAAAEAVKRDPYRVPAGPRAELEPR